MAIKGIDTILCLAEEAFVREVFHVAVIKLVSNWQVMQLSFALLVIVWLSNYQPLRYDPYEVIVRHRLIMKEVDEQFVRAYKAAGNERVLKLVVYLCGVINAKHLIDLEFILLNFRGGSVLLSECSQPKLVIDDIHSCKV